MAHALSKHVSWLHSLQRAFEHRHISVKPNLHTAHPRIGQALAREIPVMVQGDAAEEQVVGQRLLDDLGMVVQEAEDLLRPLAAGRERVQVAPHQAHQRLQLVHLRICHGGAALQPGPHLARLGARACASYEAAATGQAWAGSNNIQTASGADPAKWRPVGSQNHCRVAANTHTELCFMRATRPRQNLPCRNRCLQQNRAGRYRKPYTT